jgi:hypothetical protein
MGGNNMAEKSRLIEKELKKRLDPTKIGIGSDIGPINNLTQGGEAYPPTNDNFGVYRQTKK